MKATKLLELQKEVNEIWTIVFFASASYRVVEYLFEKADDLEMQIISENDFLLFSRITHWRTVVLELCKLFPENRFRHHHSDFNLSVFINKIQEDPDFAPLISIETRGRWNADIQSYYDEDPISKKKVIERLCQQRDKKIAHTDKNRYDFTEGHDTLTLRNVNDVIKAASRIVNEISELIFQNELGGVLTNDPTANLKKIIREMANNRSLR